MAAVGDDAVLVKIAVFGFAMSILCTAMISVLLVDNGSDYDYDEITGYRDQLVSFSGESMINQTPWVLQHVYTPWNSSYDSTTHRDDDNWLYGEDIDPYVLDGHSYLGEAAAIKLDPTQKSSTPLNYTQETYTDVVGYKFWAPGSNTLISKIFLPVTTAYTAFTGSTGAVYGDVTTNSWNFTGYRYVFDPTLPFSNEGSSVDGSLSIVWYDFNGQEGLSGGLVIYGGDVEIANYSAVDIVADYNSTSGYATVYDFVFQGTTLTLSVRFDQNAIEAGMPLMSAWTQGYWSMAISSPSAGSFFDIDGSSSFSVTSGNMISTFIKIFTFNAPEFGNEIVQFVLWCLVGLPMTMAMALITLRLVNGFRVL